MEQTTFTLFSEVDGYEKGAKVDLDTYAAVLRAVSADLQGIGTSALRLLPLPALKAWTT